MNTQKILKTLFFVLTAGMLFGSASCTSFHYILGNTYGWDAADIQILVDAQVGQLRIRHVRRSDANCVSGYSDHLEIQGHIGPDSTAAVERLLPKLHECIGSDGTNYSNLVYLSSGGGMLIDGFRMGILFREYQVTTDVGGDARCASSCAIAFLGGTFRIMDHEGQLLFHAPYRANGIAIDCTNSGDVDELNVYYKTMLGSGDGQYLFDRTMSYCSSSSGWTLNADGAKLFNITTS